MREVFIVSAARTPMGSFMGVFSGIPATRLGATAIKGALEKAGIDRNQVNEVFMGQVLQAGAGQAPARQAAIFAGLGHNVPCTTVNKVCASGMKAVMLAAQSVAIGDNDLVVAGGMENMTQVPHYLIGSRNGTKYGDAKLMDGLALDGLTDVYNQYAMGMAAELCAETCNITRNEQDEYAVTSYNRSAEAWRNNAFASEIVGVEVKDRKGNPTLITEDEEYNNVVFDKISSLRPAFKKDGTVTAANASTMNDGAAALVLCSREKMKALGLVPIAKIAGYADAAQAPEWFTTAPSLALPIAVAKAGLQMHDLQYVEINEAFSVVSIANVREMKLNAERVNVFGGAVSLGHPLGCSGARILVTLINVLKSKNAKTGGAAICNGGGGASAMVIQLV